MLRIDPGVFQAADKFLPNPIAAQKHKAKSKKSAAEKPTILVVDDQQMIADTTAEILNKHGFRAVRAYSGQAALQLAEKLKPDYLLADVLMPRMNGMELAIAISKMLPSTKIVLFSGQAGISDILREGEEKGYIFDLVAKPIHPEKLIEHLKRKQ
jgi:CheY-like chemotaxis protein